MTRLAYRIRPLAEADLDGHAHYIAQDNLDAALRLYDCAEATYRMLSEMPFMGALYQSTRTDLFGIRYLPVKDYSRYLVFYRPTDAFVDIIRILHARMDKDGWL